MLGMRNGMEKQKLCAKELLNERDTSFIFNSLDYTNKY